MRSAVKIAIEMNHPRGSRPRARSGRAVNVTDWERQSQVLSNWNDGMEKKETKSVLIVRLDNCSGFSWVFAWGVGRKQAVISV